MNLLSDIITYIRRIVKTPSGAVLTDNLIIDYINRFYINDVDARIQLFDFKTKYQFVTVPGVDRYNMPLYSLQTEPGSQTVSYYPVYQGFTGRVLVNGIPINFSTESTQFNNVWSSYQPNQIQVGIGDGSAGPYTFSIPLLNNIQSPSSTVQYPISSCILRGHVDITGIISTNQNIDPPVVTPPVTFIASTPVTSVFPAVYFTSSSPEGASVVVCDSGEFLSSNQNEGLLMAPGTAPFGNAELDQGYGETVNITAITAPGVSPTVLTANNSFQVGQSVLITNVQGMVELNDNYYTITSVNATTVTIDVDTTGFTAYTTGGEITSFTNTINYLTGDTTDVFFPNEIANGAPIYAQCIFYQLGMPRAVLFYNNILTFRSPPSSQFVVEMDAYLSPAAFLSSSQAVPFGYMSEYIARGAARKILSDTGDTEQFAFYEPLFREQEMLVWKRSQRQFTSTRTQTIYSQGNNRGFIGGNYGQTLY